MPVALAVFALFVFGGLATYTIVERRHRRRWRRIEHRPIEGAQAPFRRHAGPPIREPVLVQTRAPRTIRRTALWSIYMGQMAVPGGLLGLVGLMVHGLGLVAIPGMILAVRIWRLGPLLLRRDPKAEKEARQVRDFAVVLNVAGVLVGVALLGLCGFELLGVALVLWVYGAVSFAHAAAAGRCAEILARDHAARVEDHHWARGSGLRPSREIGTMPV
jgi:hypothetical protein